MDNKYIETFKEEAYELLTELESSVLELKEFPDNTELVDRVFRAIHTIKGSGAMFGFDDIATFTHEVETVFALVRKKEIVVTSKLIGIILSAKDHIQEMLKSFDGGDEADETKAKEIITSLRKLMPGNDRKEKASENSADSLSDENTVPSNNDGENITYRIRFRPAPDIFMNGTNPICLLDELRALGECEVVAQTDDIPTLEEINPESCYTYWDIILTTRQKINAIKDIFIFVADDCELDITIINDTNNSDNESDYRKLGEILVGRGDITQEDLKETLQSQKRIGEMLIDAKLTTCEHVQSALSEQQQVRDIRAKIQNAETALSIKVPSTKLDSFLNLVGELVIVQEHLSQFAREQYNPELLSISEEVERLTEELRDGAMSVRMVPIGATFNKFKRLVHDLSHELGKEVEMVTDGAETELDKTVIERLNDPMTHLIRNSIDHGIESPDIREAAGKPRQGTIHLSAIHSGYNIMIRIKDDGMGLDSEAIRNKAIENGLITVDTKLTEEELFALIFTPGFSTAKEVTNVSGRGVGMDVVRSTLEALRSSIDISSQYGMGTTITIKIPLTLAIIEGLLVEIGNEGFILPLSVVEECVELTHNEIASSNGGHIINLRDEIVPYINLRNKFMIEGKPPHTEQVVIARVDGNRTGFVVDKVKGEHQTVIKTLGKVYENVQGVSGATILGNGHVALILDIPMLIKEAESEQLIKERR